MKNFRKILFLLLTLTLVFAIASCGTTSCDKCVDGDGDGLCDTCKQKIEDGSPTVSDIVLIEDEEVNFQIVLAKDVPTSVKQTINASIKAVYKNTYGIDINVVTDGSAEDEEQDVEILVGKISSRGDKYILDGHDYGQNGYAMKIVGTKVLINGGSEDSLVDAVTKLAENVLFADDATNVTITATDCVEKKQTDYKITALKVNGNDMRGYTLAVDLSNADYKAFALNLQDVLYQRSGYWFEIVDIEDATSKSFVIKSIPKVSGNESFKIYADGTTLVIQCAYDNMLQTATDKFLKENVLLASGDIDFKGTVYTQDISVLHYEDFGAKGDGETDDFEAMYNTHVMANKGGQTVLGTPGATYYIFNTKIRVDGNTSVKSIPIRTNTDWQGAKIIIDDRELAIFAGGPNKDMASSNIFSVLPDDEHKKVTFKDRTAIEAIVAAGLKPGTTKIDLKISGWDGPMMIIPYNESHGVFRRKGYGQHSGEPMQEVIVIDENGNVSEETPIMFDYTSISYIEVYKLDPTSAISVGNGVIETIDTLVNHKTSDIAEDNYKFNHGYRARGIIVTRSYTTVHDVEHIVSGGFNLKDRANGAEGASVSGMFRAQYANHVTFKDCIIPGRHCYGNSSTYNFGARSVNKIVLDGCIQSNFWITVDYETGDITGHKDYVEGAVTNLSSVKFTNDKGKEVSLTLHWGIGGTNYCKNMEYIDSQISRFDAHAGLYNGKIINTNINGLELTGVGDLVIENTHWYQYGESTPFLFLRSDYGYHWDGDIIVKDTTAHLFDITGGSPTLYIANHAFANWYYGYTCAFPNITLDNFSIYSTKYNRPMDEGYTAHLFKFKETAQKMHLTGDTGVASIFDYSNVYGNQFDKNGDKYIDEPLYDYNLDGKIDESDRIDVDGNGVIGETSITMESLKDKSKDSLESGIKHPSCTRNLNVTKPPAYIKIINNNGGYRYRVVNTAGKGISSGGWYGIENDGGFFGSTKFIYGEGKDEYFLGSDFVKQKKTKTFEFVKDFYS